jgi:ubiquinone biosynthesis protein COQ9
MGGMENMCSKLAGLALATAVAFGGGIALSQPADAQTDRMQQREERLEELVDDAVITEERADEIRARVAERIAIRDERRATRTAHLEDLAATLGTTPDELKADLRAGASIADLAAAAGVDIDTIIDRIAAQQVTRINEALANGTIDQEQADERLESLRDRITARVNGERPQGRRGIGRAHHNRGGN